MADEFYPGFHQPRYKKEGSTRNTISGPRGYEFISMANYYNSPGGSMNLSSSGGGLQVFSPTAVQNNSVGPSSSLLLDSVPGLKHDTGLAVEWSTEEQYKLEEGLAKYSNEPHIMQYIKIAASLQDKTVRDVALRCIWVMKKRSKQEKQSVGRRRKDHSDMFIGTSLKNNMSSASPLSVQAYSLPTNHHNQSDYMLPGVFGCSTRHLLEENRHAFGQISSNISSLKFQENIDLFFRTRNNLTTVLNDMRNTPGIMSQMPPLPVLLNEELASSIFPHSFQTRPLGASNSIMLKQEPRC